MGIGTTTLAPYENEMSGVYYNAAPSPQAPMNEEATRKKIFNPSFPKDGCDENHVGSTDESFLRESPTLPEATNATTFTS
jgi:hypothetical protein